MPGMTGANFAVAETGAVVTVTNEGNADLSGNVPKLRICSVGIEKIIPTSRDLAVFIRLLSRSAIGMPITQYTSHFRGAARGRRNAHHSGRQRPLGPPRHGEVLAVAQMHSLRRLHEYLPCLPPQRRPQLRIDLYGPIGIIMMPTFDIRALQRASLLIHAERQLLECLSGKDQYPRSDLRVARRDGRKAPDQADEKSRHGRCRRSAQPPRALPHRYLRH